MQNTMRRGVMARAFTLIELIAVIVVLAILSGIAIPKYFDYTNRAKESSCKATLGAVRSAVHQFHANASLTGAAAYPSLATLETLGSVLQEPIPANPYYNGANPENANDVIAATWNDANPPVGGDAGWNYDATAGRFWANSANNGQTKTENKW
jgi:general secretion pathway protein G